MRQIDNISTDTIQRHTIILDNGEITLKLRYLPVVQIWLMDVSYQDKVINGVKLSLGVLHVEKMNWPFDFVVYTDGEELDPFLANDFSLGRCSLYMLEADEMEDLRGYPVKL